MPRQTLLIFASGTKTGGGTGFRNLVESSRAGRIDAMIVGVVSSVANGGVRAIAKELNIPFTWLPRDADAAAFQRIVFTFAPDWIALSGWLRPVLGLDPRRTFNIHPGPLPRFGGQGMYGRRVHETVLAAYMRGEIASTEIVMHFVTPNYDEGPIFFRAPVDVKCDDTIETLAQRVQLFEHAYQPAITNMVVTGQISWDGVDPASMKYPAGYIFR